MVNLVVVHSADKLIELCTYVRRGVLPREISISGVSRTGTEGGAFMEEESLWIRPSMGSGQLGVCVLSGLSWYPTNGGVGVACLPRTTPLLLFFFLFVFSYMRILTPPRPSLAAGGELA